MYTTYNAKPSIWGYNKQGVSKARSDLFSSNVSLFINLYLFKN